MRVSSISYNMYNRSVDYSSKKRQASRLYKNNFVNNSEPSFQGCNVGKVIGCIVGTAAVVVFFPSVAMVGLAGLGTLTGAAAGSVLDDKIDKMKNDKNDSNNRTKC